MPIRSLPLKPSHLAAAIMLGLAVPGIGLAQDAASPPEGTARTLDTVTVTGSRIKRTEIETQLPITVLQKERIDALGISSAEQLLMFLNIAGNSSDNLASNGRDTGYYIPANRSGCCQWRPMRKIFITDRRQPQETGGDCPDGRPGEIPWLSSPDRCLSEYAH